METTKIYLLIDPINFLPQYIGKSDNLKNRLKNHIRCTIHKKGHLNRKEAWIKSLINKGLTPIISELDEIPENEWKFWEQHYISLFRSWNFDLKNGTIGGDGWSKGHVPANKGIPHSEEFKRKLSALKIGQLNNRFGKKLSIETKIKIGLGNKGKKISDESKYKMHLAKIGKYKGCNSPHFGKKRSIETINKISKKLKGRVGLNAGKKMSNNIKQKISASVSETLKINYATGKRKSNKGMIYGTQELIICSHCNKSGGASAMKRWHFDKCKNKI